MKNKIYIDLDGVIFDTIKCITQLYNDDFKYYEDFKEIDYTDVKTWNFTELNLATTEQINNYFNQKRFFDKVTTMRWANKAIDNIKNNGYEIIFISIGNIPNLTAKKIWISKKYPNATFIGIDYNKYKDKSHIDMSDGIIFIDDSYNNLVNSTCSNNVCFGREVEWNKEWNGNRILNWKDFDIKKYM